MDTVFTNIEKNQILTISKEFNKITLKVNQLGVNDLFSNSIVLTANDVEKVIECLETLIK